MLRTGARRRLAAVVRDLEVPVPFELGEFAAGLGRQRDRPILLRPFGFSPGTLCGAWIATASADYVYYEAGTTAYHATQIALHEIAHMLLGHHDTAAWEQFVRILAPDVDQRLIQLILGRSAYGTAQERDAETLASLILSGTAA